MAKFCHIAPIPHLNLVAGASTHLTLAHLVETSEEYVNFYKKEKENGATIILDNSAFEMYKQGRPMYDLVQLVEMAQRIDADYVVMSDYPNENGNKTINAASILAPKLREKGFKTFFCPQSKIGDSEDLFAGFNWQFNLIWLTILAYQFFLFLMHTAWKKEINCSGLSVGLCLCKTYMTQVSLKQQR